MARAHVAYRDLGLGRIKSELRKLDGFEVRVGFVGTSAGMIHGDAGVTMAQLAAWHEFGTRDMPARPFIRKTFERDEDDLAKALSKVVHTAMRGGTISAGLEKLGVYAASKVRKTISDSKQWAAPLAPATLHSKTVGGKVGDTPLIDTGRMRQSVTYAVHWGGA